MSEGMDPATVLEEAADLLLIHGRSRGCGIDARGRYCVIAAIAEVKGTAPKVVPLENPDKVSQPWVVELYEGTEVQILRDHLPHRSVAISRVWRWNDATADDFEVIDTLRHVAKDLRNAAVPS